MIDPANSAGIMQLHQVRIVEYAYCNKIPIAHNRMAIAGSLHCIANEVILA